MVDKIDAYKCSLTGRIFEDPREATYSEFCALMRRMVSQMPSGAAGTDAKEVADWLSSNLTGRVYPSAAAQFLIVADYLRSNRETLASR